MLTEGELLKADDTSYADADLIPLTNNGMQYVFNSLKLTLAGQKEELVNYPGHATSLLGLASYSMDYQRGCELVQGWVPDTGLNADLNTNAGLKTRQGYLIQTPNLKGSFQCAIPMKNIRFYG